MDVQIKDISDPVLKKAGEALYYAQRLEYCFVTHILVRKKLSKQDISSSLVDELEARVREKKTLGTLIREMEVEVEVDPEDSTFNPVLRFRNILAHDFFKRYRHNIGIIALNRRMTVDLEMIIIELKSNINLLQEWTRGLAHIGEIDMEKIESEYETITFESEPVKPLDLIPGRRKPTSP